MIYLAKSLQMAYSNSDMNIEVKVKTGSQASYIEAYKLLTDSTADSFGSYGINRVVYGNKYVSHMLYNGSNSIQELNDALDEV